MEGEGAVIQKPTQAMMRTDDILCFVSIRDRQREREGGWGSDRTTREKESETLAERQEYLVFPPKKSPRHERVKAKRSEWNGTAHTAATINDWLCFS